MDELTADEQLMVRVALATCFAFPLDQGGVPAEDVTEYVDHLIALHAAKPFALTKASEDLPQDVRGTLWFCAERLDTAAPQEAARLRSALDGG